MKNRSKRSDGVMKGAPSGFMVSLLVHAAAFTLAGLLVVFNVVQKEEKKFVPPKPVDRPKMKLKKPKVKIKKTAKPKSTTRIVTKVKQANMPDIQLPEMSGMGGEGFEIGGFDIMPDLGELSLLGSDQTIGNDLEGTFYDFKRNRSGGYISMDGENWQRGVHNFLRRGWRTSNLSKYYRAPKKIYTTCLVIPPVLSSIAPSAFGDKDASGVYWMVHYKGQIAHNKKITFRFHGIGDGFIAVRVNGEMVLLTEWTHVDTGLSNMEGAITGNLWESDSADSRKYVMGNSRAVVGSWITLEPGEAQDIDIAIGDQGGQAAAMLAVEVEGVEYEKSSQGGPILPAFKTEKISRDLMDIIYKDLVEEEVSLTAGPVFNDFGSYEAVPEETVTEEKVPMVEPAPPVEISPMRTWAFEKPLEAELVTVLGREVVLKNTKGKTIKVPTNRFNESDMEYIELSRPPKFDINFTRNNQQRLFKNRMEVGEPRPPQTLSRYGVRIKQTGSGSYNHELKVELFAIGQERLGDRYILFDRQTTRFIPTVENGRSHEFLSERTVVMDNYEVDAEPRGERYAGYLVTITDKRGEVIAVDTSNQWLLDHIDNLKKQKPGNYMDKACTRVFPTRPPKTRY